MELNHLGSEIKRIRKDRKLTQEQLGKLLGVGKSEVSKLEKNSRNMTVKTMFKIFKALGVNLTIEIELL